MNNAWDQVQLARHPKRPTAKVLIKHLVDDFIPLYGDRLFKDDKSILAGLGYIKGLPVTIIAQEKGDTTQTKIEHNFGMPHPEGYHKALRLMKQAEKFHRPILAIIDTPGAFPGLEAEERGQAQAIAYNLFQMAGIQTPIIVLVLSEGGSGGALAIGIGDYIMMFEHSIYAILSPEGFASILYKDGKLAPKAAELMKLTAQDLLALKVIDEIILEPVALHEDILNVIEPLKDNLLKHYKGLLKKDPKVLIEERYQKYRNMGIWNEI